MLAGFLGAVFGFFVVSAIAYTYFRHVIAPKLIEIGMAGYRNARHGMPYEQAFGEPWVPQAGPASSDAAFGEPWVPRAGPASSDAATPNAAAMPAAPAPPPELSLAVVVQISEKLEGHWQELRAKCGCELCVEIFRIYGGPQPVFQGQA